MIYQDEPTAQNVSGITRFLWWCSGASIPILSQCSTEKAKYEGIGATVLLTGALATLTMACALRYAPSLSDFPWAVAVFWGILIFNLDRYIVATFVKGQRISVFFRFLLALVLAVFISATLELTLFEKEINRKIEDIKKTLIEKNKINAIKNKIIEQTSTNTEQSKKIEQDIADLNTKISQQKTDINTARDNLDKERGGKSPTGKKGNGSSAVEKNDDLQKQKSKLQAYEIELANKNNEKTKLFALLEPDSIKNAIKDDLSKYEEKVEKSDGILFRFQALIALLEEERELALIEYVVSVILVLLDCLPLINKILGGDGEYERRIKEVILKLDSEFESSKVITNTYYEEKTKAVQDVYKNKFSEWKNTENKSNSLFFSLKEKLNEDFFHKNHEHQKTFQLEEIEKFWHLMADQDHKVINKVIDSLDAFRNSKIDSIISKYQNENIPFNNVLNELLKNVFNSITVGEQYINVQLKNQQEKTALQSQSNNSPSNIDLWLKSVLEKARMHLGKLLVPAGTHLGELIQGTIKNIISIAYPFILVFLLAKFYAFYTGTASNSFFSVNIDDLSRMMINAIILRVFINPMESLTRHNDTNKSE